MILPARSSDVSVPHLEVQRPVVAMAPEWWSEFEAAAARPLAQRLGYAFIGTHKPVLDGAPFRTFDTMRDYRAWCVRHLSSWLGCGD